MSNNQSISLKSEEILVTKKKLNLAMNILISFLGITSLFIKFFLVDGLLAFRAFTVDGNLFTTVVSIIVVIVNIRELKAKQEFASKRLFFLQLASTVTEAVIFIVVMIGYLPIFPDDPKITPYHMFCLHVAIPILAVLRFIFFEKPQGVIKPSKLLIGAIPIGVYGIGVVTAIKLGILPTSLVPYSFLDFESNYLWYFFFALTVIPSFGFLWSWLFYRLNLCLSLLWYAKDDLERLQKARVKAMSSFDVINSNILLIYCALAILLLMFSLMGTSKTSTKVMHELMSTTAYLMLDDYDHMLGKDTWYVEGGSLYKGDLKVGDGTEEGANQYILDDDVVVYDVTFFIQARDLSPNLAEKYDPLDYVSVKHSSGKHGPIVKCGETLDRDIIAAVIANDEHFFYEEVKVGKESYYHYCQSFGKTMATDGVGMISLYVPMDELMDVAKNHEYNTDIMMIAVVIASFAVLFTISSVWIKTLEKSVDYLKAIASGRTPEEPIDLSKTIRFSKFSGLERELNVLWEINRE